MSRHFIETLTIVLMAASQGCNSSDPAQPGGASAGSCEGITCSDHGDCYVVGTEARCSCASGYAPGLGATCMARAAGSPPMIGSCQILPSNNIFNTPIDNLFEDNRLAQHSSRFWQRDRHVEG